jgi:hypothetical protein
MSELDDVTDEELLAEVERRGLLMAEERSLDDGYVSVTIDSEGETTTEFRPTTTETRLATGWNMGG